MNTAYKLQL